MKSTSRIRVLHVTEASNAGVGGHVLDLMEGLPDQGVDVHFAYSPNRIDDYFRSRIDQMPPKDFTPIAMQRSPHWTDLAASRALRKCIDRRGPFDIIHAHSTKAGGLCRIGRIRHRAKVIYTPNGIFSMNPNSPGLVRGLVGLAERKLANRSQTIIAVSPEEKQHMLEIGIPNKRIRMVPNGLRSIAWPSRERTRDQLGIDRNALVFGYLGRLAPQKNPMLALRSFALIKDSRPNVQLAMVGLGPLESECRQLAQQLGMVDQVDWLGFHTAQQAMPAFDAFLMPSNYEGMPYVMMEAASLGIPIVATKVGGTSLGIDQGLNGFVVPLDQPKPMADAMRSLLDDRTRQAMSNAALVKSKEFSVELMIRRTRDVYLRALGRIPPTAERRVRKMGDLSQA